MGAFNPDSLQTNPALPSLSPTPRRVAGGYDRLQSSDLIDNHLWGISECCSITSDLVRNIRGLRWCPGHFVSGRTYCEILAPCSDLLYEKFPFPHAVLLVLFSYRWTARLLSTLPDHSVLLRAGVNRKYVDLLSIRDINSRRCRDNPVSQKQSFSPEFHQDGQEISRSSRFRSSNDFVPLVSSSKRN